MSSLFIVNTLLLLGTVIGAGTFSLPIALLQGGVLVFFFCIIFLGFLMVKVNIFYRQIVEVVPGRHQLVGYVSTILGKPAGVLVLFLDLFSLFGALLAYLIIAGEFLAPITHASSQSMSILFFIVVAVLLLVAGKLLEFFDTLFTILKVILLVTVVIMGFILLQSVPFKTLPLIGPQPFVAYGAILFASTGFSILPELKQDKSLRHSLIIGQTLSMLLYSLFAISLYSFVVGEGFHLPGGSIGIIFNLAGLCAVFTPYLMLSWVIYDILNKDIQLPKKDSLLLVTVIPLLLFFLGIHSFSTVIAVTGGIFIGGIAIIISRMYMKQFPGQNVLLNYLVQVTFFLGIVFELLQVYFTQ